MSIVLIVHQSDVRRGRGMAQRRCWPGLVSHYASLPPHDRETVTRPGQIGVAFSTHRDVGYDTGGGRRTTSYSGGSVICSGDSVLVEYAGVPVDSDRRPTRLSRAALGRVYDLIEAELHGCLTLDRLAEHAHLSPFHFARAFKASVGMTPHAFVISRRMDRARDLLRGTEAPVEHVAGDVGFANLSHFRRVFRAHTGATPSQFRALTG